MQLLGVTLLSRYRIEKVLGSGGFGDTYLSRDLALPHHPFCVVKHLKPKTESPEVKAIAQSLFEREAHMLYELGEHASIPRLFAHFEQDGEFFLVQEFIEGHDLSAELGAIWSASQVQSLVYELLQILAVLHQKQVIHRDIKPQNIMRRHADGKLFLIDFGAVKEIPQLTVTSTGATALTVAIGSPGYMPNEQAAGKPRAASDIYAVGMIAIQALTGQVPTLLPCDPETGDRIWSVPADVSVPFAAFLKRMTQDHFSQRFQDAGAALAQLSSQEQMVPSTVMQPSVRAQDQPPQPIPPNDYQPSAPPRRNWLVGVVAAGGLMAVGAGIVMAMHAWNGSIQVTSTVDSSGPEQSSVDITVQRKYPSNTENANDQTIEIAAPPVSASPEENPSQPLSDGNAIAPPRFEPVGSALVIDPPSNVRLQPNGIILCAVDGIQMIDIGISQGNWYRTNFCGDLGVIHISQLSFNPRQARVIDPPSNVRSQPNGPIICSIPVQRQINVFEPTDGWYPTHVCQSDVIGYIHNSQISLN